MNSPRADVEVDVAQRMHLDLAHAIGLGERAGAEHGTAVGSAMAPCCPRAAGSGVSSVNADASEGTSMERE